MSFKRVGDVQNMKGVSVKIARDKLTAAQATLQSNLQPSIPNQKIQ